jgi:hypothetical protein
MTETIGRRSEDSGQQAAKASRHMPAASLGHYAALSFVVRGRMSEVGGRRSEVRGQKTDDDSKSNGQFVE